MLGVVANELKPAYLLTGSDRPKIARALRRLRERIGDDSTEHLNARDASAADVIASCNAMGLFGGEDGRLVIVEEAERWKAPDVKELSGYLAAPSPSTVQGISTTASSGRPGRAPSLRTSTTWTSPVPAWSEAMSRTAASE